MLSAAFTARHPGKHLIHRIDSIAVAAVEAVRLDEAQQHLQGMVLQGLHDYQVSSSRCK